MRYVMWVIATDDPAASGDEMAAIDAFNDQMRADGQWVLAAGLAHPSTATVVDARGAEPVLTEGALYDGPEFLSGMWIIEVPDHATAMKLAEQGSRACNRKIELRAFL